MDLLALAFLLPGLIVGLGAVTVIDLHGFLGRRSPYWTEATVRTHKVTKPLIWIGATLYGCGLALAYGTALLYEPLHRLQLAAWVALVLNGCFLTFVVSPFLLRREREGRARELLPFALQAKIAASFVLSVAGWWGSVALLAVDLARSLR